MVYTTRADVEAYPVTLPAGAAGDRIVEAAERDVDALLGPYPRDPATGLKWDPARLYDWQAAALARAVAAQAEYLVELGPAGVTPAATTVKGPDFELTFDSAAAARPRVGPKVARELEPIADLVRVVGARARA